MPSGSSTRVWLTCGLVTAAAVAAALVITNRRDAEADGMRPPPPPPPLTEQEVRTYLFLKPEEDRILRQIALEFQEKRRLGQADDEALGEIARARVDALLLGQHLTRETWHALKERVERVFNLIRAEAEFPEAKPGILKRLEMKKSLLKSLEQSDPRRVNVEREIRETEDLLANGPPKVSEEDRELALRYWASLERVATTIGPPLPPEEREAPRGK